MNEWLKKLISQVKELWSKWTVIQKVILTGIVVVAIGALILVSTVSSQPTTVPLFSVPVTDEVLRDQIVFRLAEENVTANVTEAGMISVANESVARRMRTILVTDDLVPGNVDPWQLFDVERWTTTDFLNDVNLQRSITLQVTQHIEALDEIDRADIILGMPKKELFSEDQKPTTASVILTPKPGSDFISDKRKIEGVQRLLLMSIPGLTAANITISDATGIILNDFEGLELIERVDIIAKEQQLIETLENTYRKKILTALQSTYNADRVRDVNVRFEMNMSAEEINKTEYSGITLKPDNPDTPYDDSEIINSITLSSQEINKIWQGTGYNPEGPAGVEGQNPPVYSDMSNMYGVNEESSTTTNELVNTTLTTEIKSPKIDRFTVAVNIDGLWERKYDEETGALLISPSGQIEREYIPVSIEELESVALLVQGALGYDRTRNDMVTIQNVRFDRTIQFDEENLAFMRDEQAKRTIFIAVTAVIAVLLAFIVFRFISREVERKRRIREEELLRKHQLEREKTLWDAQQTGMEVTMSVEERERAELIENAITIAREHPDDVAMLIRSWLMEE